MAEASSSIEVRALDAGDHAGVLEIYNHYIENSPCTFDTQPFSMAARVPWFAQFEHPMYTCLVALQTQQVVGYACCMRFKEKPAYGTSAEVSIYIHPAQQGRGIGTILYEPLIDFMTGTDLHRAYAGITLPNEGSVALHRKFGFERVGLYTEVGFKFDRYWDVAWYEKRLA